MAEQVYIEGIADHVGERVTIKGWLYAKTGKGRLQFLQVRDGTGIVQCVVFKKAVTPEVFDAARQLTQESSLIVTGQVRADERAPGIPGGIEMDVAAEGPYGVVGVVWVVENIDGRREIHRDAAGAHVGPERVVGDVGVFLAPRSAQGHVPWGAHRALLIADHDADTALFVHRKQERYPGSALRSRLLQKVHHAGTVFGILEIFGELKEETADPPLLDQVLHRLVQLAALIPNHVHLTDLVFQT